MNLICFRGSASAELQQLEALWEGPRASQLPKPPSMLLRSPVATESSEPTAPAFELPVPTLSMIMEGGEAQAADDVQGTSRPAVHLVVCAYAPQSADELALEPGQEVEVSHARVAPCGFRCQRC
jgi:hypothetical protein